MSSLKESYDIEDDHKAFLTGEKMSLPSIILMKGEGANEDEIMKELPLDKESRKYIHVSLDNIIKTYHPETNEETVTVNTYPIEKCSSSIMRSTYEKKFFEHRM